VDWARSLAMNFRVILPKPKLRLDESLSFIPSQKILKIYKFPFFPHNAKI
jgi:hypothetical protein